MKGRVNRCSKSSWPLFLAPVRLSLFHTAFAASISYEELRPSVEHACFKDGLKRMILPLNVTLES